MPRVFAFPSKGTAYTESLYSEFRAQGAEVVEGVWAGRWLLANLRPEDVVHIHWPSLLYMSQGSPLRTLRDFARFLGLLALVRLTTRHIWWTAHNLMPHERSPIRQLDVVARRAVVRLASRVFVHGPQARHIVEQSFPGSAGKLTVIPHGHWIGRYPGNGSATQARAALGIPDDAFVYLLLGHCRPYKNLEALIAAFQRAAQPGDILQIAGRFPDPGYLQHIRALAANDDRIRLAAGFIPDEQVSLYLKASNIVCLPYKEILTSGSAILALSYGRPVLSIDKGFLKDAVPPECGLLVANGDTSELAPAMAKARGIQWDESRIVEHARQFTFTEAARLSLAALAR